MTTLPNANASGRPAHARPASIQTYARIAGVLFLLSVVAGGFGEFYVPTRLIVSADAGATARNVAAFDSFFRLGFAAYLVEAVCDVALTLVLYVLLRPVHGDVALLAAFFRLVSTAVFAFAELFYFTAALVLGGADYLKTFSPEQLNALALLSLKVYGTGAGVFMVFYGVAAILLGYLMFQSGYLPKALGALLALGGVGFVIRNFALVLTPRYAYFGLALPMTAAGLSLAGWLLVKGVDAEKWGERASRSAG